MPFLDDPVLHVGDRLRFVCPELPEINVDRSVGPDGTIDFPLLGGLPAAARRLSELTHTAMTLLPASAGVDDLRVLWLGPSVGNVTIVGAVERPFSVYAPKGIRKERLIGAAKPTRDADLALLKLPGKIVAGSTVFVASATAERRIGVVGGVVTPQSLPPTANLLLASALDAAGGLSVHADANAIVVARAGEPIPVSLPADSNFLLQPGDVVRVGLIADRRFIMVTGLVGKPGSVDFAPGMTATKAIAAAGGLLPSSKSGVLVWRSGPKTFRLSIAFLFERRIPDPILGPDDSLVIEASKP